MRRLMSTTAPDTAPDTVREIVRACAFDMRKLHAVGNQSFALLGYGPSIHMHPRHQKMTATAPEDPIDPTLIRIAAERLAQAPIPSTNAFYAKLFQVAPVIRPLFPEEMFQQSEKLWNSIVAVVEYAEDLDRLRPLLREMGARHVAYGATPAYYDAVVDTLLETIAMTMADDWTQEQERAWAHVLRRVADMMIEGAHEAAA
ncbi:globin domain-containing protein [Flavimaricola marinus]|uniref:Bacterial hemoglobin n=1 Tax=Flavimaricola marinus TaxID=1819565 RepID=A0A238LDQ7_9RHOB|nr:globin domain-containing protein [Flavimaricola marinus]SMY07545.1 Bacterial hemoglobin [Flavimaricola marinus]